MQAPISRSRDVSRNGPAAVHLTSLTQGRRPQWRRAGTVSFGSLERSYFGGTSSLSIKPRASDFKGSVCTCASYTRPHLVHLRVRYSNPARIWTTLWTVGRARHLGQRGRPSGAVDATGSDGGASMSPIGPSFTGADNPFGPVLVPRQLNLVARNGHGLPHFKPLETRARCGGSWPQAPEQSRGATLLYVGRTRARRDPGH
jgi:hypothetical protein